jgi:hypothetical protein
MSTTTRRPANPASYDAYEDTHGEGWVLFAGIMIMIAGVLNFIYGIAAVANSHFYAPNTHYVISDLDTWGWVVMLIGVVQLCVALGVWIRAAWARWTGVAVAALNALVQLIFIASNPLLSLSIVALDVLVIYGLVTYGGHQAEQAW